MSYQRREKILEILKRNGTVMLHDLEKIFPDISSMTLRRDLDFFEKLGEIVRIRGGAKYIKSLTPSQEDVYELREIKNQAAKEHIAALAAAYAEDGRSIYIDSGTTGMYLARALPDAPFSIVTSGPNIAVELSKKFKPAIALVGGFINRTTLSVSGLQSTEFLKDFNIDIAFIAASAFSASDGFTCGNKSECELKKKVIAKAKKTIILADSTKFDKTMPFTFAHPEKVSVLITEKQVSDEIAAVAKKSGMKVEW